MLHDLICNLARNSSAVRFIKISEFWRFNDFFYFIFIVNLFQWVVISISKFVKLFWSQNLYSKLLSLKTSNFISEGVAPRDESALGDHLPSLFSSETALIPYLLRLVHILVDSLDLQKNCTKGQLVMIFFQFCQNFKLILIKYLCNVTLEK